jgi:hypothetical protein
MALDIKDGRFFYAMWFVPLDKPIDRDGVLYRHGDWHAAVYKDEGEDDICLYYRFRYYVDGKTGLESDDKKSVYIARSKEPASSVMAAVDKVAEAIAQMNINSAGKRAEMHKILLHTSNAEEIMKRMAAEEFVHMTPLKEK